MRFADTIDATALSVSPTWRLSNGRSSFTATGMLSHLSGAWSNSAFLDGSWTTRPRGLLSWEAEGVAGGSAHSDGARTGQFTAFGRAHLGNESRGAWLGAGIGAAWDDAWRDVRQADAGAWLSAAGGDHLARLRPTIVDDSIRYTDIEVMSRLEFGRWEFDGSLGGRAGDPIPTLPANHKAWGSASASFQIMPRMALVGSAGIYPVDFAQGYPGGRYLSLSVRFRSARLGGNSAVGGTTDSILREFRADPESAGRYRLRLLAPTASTVEMAGDFTQWQPQILVREPGGWWSTTVAIANGTHEVAIRVDGGAWRAPPGLMPITDEFGGRSGLLVIPP